MKIIVSLPLFVSPFPGGFFRFRSLKCVPCEFFCAPDFLPEWQEGNKINPLEEKTKTRQTIFMFMSKSCASLFSFTDLGI